MKNLVSVKEMRDYESALFAKGISADIVMENAGRLCAQELINAYFNDGQTGQVSVFCGPGNNGGDGLVLARCLLENRIAAVCYIMRPRGEYKPLVLKNIKRAFVCGLSVKEVESVKDVKAAIEKSFIAVDAVLGLGAAPETSPFLEDLCAAINTCKTVISIDGPTGVDMDSGKPYLKNAVKATQTYTLGFIKKGLVVAAAKEYTGKLLLLDIFSQIGGNFK
ncbi:MAG: NAD(P)H-hydrate epimerase [Elusimicrobiota bacterium]|jgi:NAD(P)H-hydrate epimerase|nr:NAD(P)H-hydrate epimerase [Elusimicrobiota bacterium]